MRYEQLEDMGDENFRRLTGVKRVTFEHMKNILIEETQKKKANGGRPSKLSVADQLLMALEYIREYRTYFHTGRSYDVSESSAYKTIKWIEDTLNILILLYRDAKLFLRVITTMR